MHHTKRCLAYLLVGFFFLWSCGRDVPAPSAQWDLSGPSAHDAAMLDFGADTDLIEPADFSDTGAFDSGLPDNLCASGALPPSTSLNAEGDVWTRVFEPFEAGAITYQLLLEVKNDLDPSIWQYYFRQRFCVASSEPHYIWTTFFTDITYPDPTEQSYIYRGTLSLVDDSQHEYVLGCADMPLLHTFEFNPFTAETVNYAAELPLNSWFDHELPGANFNTRFVASIHEWADNRSGERVVPEEYKARRLDYSQPLRMRVYWPRPQTNGTDAPEEVAAHIFKLCRETGWIETDNFPGSSQDAFFRQDLGELNLPEGAVQQLRDRQSFLLQSGT